jgi:sulfate adenylyltransferase subunit 2
VQRSDIFRRATRSFEWDYKDQPPGILGSICYPALAKANTCACQPLLDWTEGRYLALHPARKHTHPRKCISLETEKRFRSLGCSPITQPIESNASTIDEIIAELEETKTTERAGRAQDHYERNAMQKLRRKDFCERQGKSSTLNFRRRAEMQVVFVGHVDHGKVNAIGRILA